MGSPKGILLYITKHDDIIATMAVSGISKILQYNELETLWKRNHTDPESQKIINLKSNCLFPLSNLETSDMIWL